MHSLPVINWPGSHRCVRPLLRGPAPGYLADVLSSDKTRSSSSRRQFSNPRVHKCAFSAAYSSRSRPDPIPTAMNAEASHASELDAPSPSEDFVSIEGPASPIHQEPIENLVQSISSVDEDRGDEGCEDGEAGDDDQRKVLPEELLRSVMTLSCESSAEGGICDVYLVGTAHVSQESCQEVQAVIRYLKPQVVFLELCSSRVATLTPQNLRVPTMKEMVEMWKKQHNIFGILYGWFLAKVANKLEVFPGSEFRVAFEETVKYGGKVVLGDRPVQVTLQRTWAKMPLWHKTKLLYSLVFQAFFLPSPEELTKMLKAVDDVDMLTLVIQEMSKEFPTLMETLVHERDQFMSSTLLRVAREHSSVVAVVGKGHLQGIKKNWKQPVEVRKLLEVHMSSGKQAVSPAKILKTLGVAVAGVAIISGIYLSIKK